MKVRCFIFDLDGTIVETDYDWRKIRKEIGCEEEPILTYLERLSEPERTEKWQILQQYEKQATDKAMLKEGIGAFISYLQNKKIKTALVTNNSRENTKFLLEKFHLNFDKVLTRESGLWKPSGLPFLKIVNFFRVQNKECAVVGDSVFDVTAAREAGIPHIFILSHENQKFSKLSVKVFSQVPDLYQYVKREIFAEE